MKPLLATLAITTAILVAQAPAAPLSIASPAVAPLTPSGCSPKTNGGNCYEPGEKCRNSDHGASGVSGGGENIVCRNNDGWRWEPASYTSATRGRTTAM
jgi:hypothetical protein